MEKTVSLETAKKLKEAGWPQDEKTSLYWTSPAIDWRGGKPYLVPEDYKSLSLCSVRDFGVAAPDVSELLEAFNDSVSLHQLHHEDGGFWFNAQWMSDFGTVNISSSQLPERTEYRNPAEALAALYLELKKQKII